MREKKGEAEMVIKYRGELRVGWNALGGIEVLNAVEVVEDVFKAKFKA